MSLLERLKRGPRAMQRDRADRFVMDVGDTLPSDVDHPPTSAIELLVRLGVSRAEQRTQAKEVDRWLEDQHRADALVPRVLIIDLQDAGLLPSDYIDLDLP